MILPTTPAWTSHAVFEVPAEATADQIQALIEAAAQSGDPLPIVHFGFGTWHLDKTLQVARYQNVQIVGDGYGSVLTASARAGSGVMLNIVAPARVTVRDMQWVARGASAISVSQADHTGGRIQIVGSQLGPIVANHLELTQLSMQANPSVASISFTDVIHAVAMSNGVIGPINLTNGSSFLLADTWYEGPETALFRMDSGTFTYQGGHVAPRASLSSPIILLNGFNGTASWLGMVLDASALPAGPSIQINAGNPQTHAYLMGVTSNRDGYFRLTGAGATVGFMINRTANAGASISAQDQNVGASSTTAIHNAWSQARSLHWDSVPYDVPDGSVDIRIYHMKADQTSGLHIAGQ